MSHILSLSDGTTTLDLAMTTDPGYHFVSYVPPRPNRLLARTSGFPNADGDSTRASSLGDVSADFVVTIVGTSADDLDARFQTLIKLLEAAQRWEERHIGAPVRLKLARQGVTNSSYRVVTGVPAMPRPMDAETIDWFDLSSIANEMTVAFTLTMAPVAHADALTTAKVEPISSNPNDDGATATSPLTGTMPAPLAVTVQNTGAIVWTEVWIAHLAEPPQVFDSSGFADAGAFNGFYQQYIVSGATEATVSLLPLTPTIAAPVRGILRVKVTSGDATRLQLQFRVTTGTGLSGQTSSAPWVTYAGVGTNWTLIDLGSVRLPPLFTTRISQDPLSVATLAAYARSADGSSITFGVDFLQALPYHSFVKLKGNVGLTDKAQYEMISRSGTFHWPQNVSQEFVTTNVQDRLIRPLERHGSLKPVPAGAQPSFWCAMHVVDGHSLSAGGELTIKYLPCYALGLRGAL